MTTIGIDLNLGRAGTEPEKCTLLREGFEAHWFPGTICPEKAIIEVGGTSCDERTSIAMSGFLRKRGYNVLVLGFYMWKGLPKDPVSIPVDFVEKAVRWLKGKKGMDKVLDDIAYDNEEVSA